MLCIRIQEKNKTTHPTAHKKSGSFSEMKLIKTRLQSRLTEQNLARLMRIAIEGPELNEINFSEILDIFKQSNHRIIL